jgi:hypothetical protein
VITTKIRNAFIHLLDVIRYKVRANDVLPVDVAKMPNAATMMVFRFMVLRLS